jgi:hypothetical protein
MFCFAQYYIATNDRLWERSQRNSDTAVFAPLRSLRETYCSIELQNVQVSDTTKV